MSRYRDRLPDACVPLAEHPLAEPVHHLAVVQVPDRAAATARSTPPGSAGACTTRCRATASPPSATFADGPLPVAERAAERSSRCPCPRRSPRPRSSGSAPCSQEVVDDRRHHQAEGERPRDDEPHAARGSRPERVPCQDGRARRPAGAAPTVRPPARTDPRAASPDGRRRDQAPRSGSRSGRRRATARAPAVAGPGAARARCSSGWARGRLARSPTACRRCTPRRPTSSTRSRRSSRPASCARTAT